MRLRARAVALALAGTVLGASAGGCGGAESLSKQEYTREVRELSQSVGRETQSPQEAAPASAAAGLEQKREYLEQFTRGLERLEPPEEIRRAHELMISGLRDLAAQLIPIARAVREGDVQLARRLSDAIRRSEGARDVERAGQMLRAQGYPPVEVPEPDRAQGG